MRLKERLTKLEKKRKNEKPYCIFQDPKFVARYAEPDEPEEEIQNEKETKHN